MQGILTGSYKVFFLLGKYRFYVRKLAGTQNRYKDFDLCNLCAFLVSNTYFFTSKIYVQLIARLVLHMHHRINSGFPLIVVKTKLAVLITIGELFAVSFPEHVTVNTGALEL